MLKNLLFFSLILTTFSYSIINIEPPVIGETKGLSGEVSLGAVYSSGNTDSKLISLSGKGEYSEKEWLVYLIASYNYGKLNDETSTNDGLMHLRYVHNISSTAYDYEFFLQTEFNEFQAIKQRNLAGANIRKKLDLPFDKIFMGLGLFYSYTEPDTITVLDPIYKVIRMNSYLSFLKKINENFSISYLGFYQPNVEDFSDFRVSQVLQLNTSVTDDISFGFDINYAYNSTPYHQIKKGDVRSTINIRYKFK